MIFISRVATIHNDTIRYAIWCTRYDMFRDTFAILSWEAEACDPGLRSEAPHSTYYNCLRSNGAQWLQQWWPPQSFQMQCLWWIYSCYWNILVVICGISCSFLTLVSVTTVPYCIVSSSERIAICTVASVSAVYRCIVSALFISDFYFYLQSAWQKVPCGQCAKLFLLLILGCVTNQWFISGLQAAQTQTRNGEVL